ncbi:MAG: tungsten cofactor oxidoreductase radical SAM maturase [Zestosphaera sp.]
MGVYTQKVGEWILEYVDSSPKEVMVEVTTSCNYDCIHCFRKNMLNQDLNKLMSVDVFKVVLREAEDARVNKISFSGWGEPLTHPEILSFISEAKKRGFKVLLNTNGYLLPDYVDELFRVGVDELYLSVDGVSEEVYSLMRRGGILSRVSEGLMRLKELKLSSNSSKPEVYIQFTLTKLNVKDLLELPEYVKRVSAHQAVVSNVIPLSREFEKKLSCYSDTECMTIINELRDKLAKRIFATGGKISLPNFSHTSERSCPFISRNACYIRFDGSVAPCIQYSHSWVSNFASVTRVIKEVVFGNVTREHLRDIWRKPDYVKFRMNTYFFRMPSCFECNLREYCYITLSNESDCWGNTPTCASCPYAHDVVRCPL